MKPFLPCSLIIILLFISSHVSLRGYKPTFDFPAPAEAAQQASTWTCEDEPEDSQPLVKRKPDVAVMQIQSLGPIRDVVDAFTEAFPDIKIAASEANLLVIIADERPRQQHYLKVAKEALRQLDVPGMEKGYYIGNHIVRLETGDACKIAEAFQNPVRTKPDSPDPSQPADLKVIGLSEKVLVIVPMQFPVSKDPKKSKDPKTKYEFPIELERKVASLRSMLVKAGEGLAKEKEKEKKDARKKSRKIEIENVDARKVAQALKDQFPGYAISAENQKTLIIAPEKAAKPAASKAKTTPAETSAEPAAKDGPTKPEDWLVERTVKLKGLKAADVANALRNKIPGFQIRAIGADRLVILGGTQAPATPEEVKKTVAALDESAKPKETPQRAQGEFLRLFHLRDAPAVAAAFKRGTDEPVKAVGPDLLLIDPPDGKVETIWAIKRILAVLDLPRPQIALQVWSMQVSASDRSVPEERLQYLRQKVLEYNETLQRALQSGWETLRTKIKNRDAVDEDFWNYIEKDFLSCSRDNRYCLGYRDAFLASSPSLTRMLLFLAALKDPSAAINELIPAMENANQKIKPNFAGLRWALLRLMTEEEDLDAFRAAILDFLFNYKWAIVYPSDLIPYDLKHSAHVLDSMLTPIHDALAQDLRLFIENLQKDYNGHVDLRAVSKDEKSSSNGIIRVTTLSGTQAKSTGKTSNYFDITMPIGLDELLKQNDLITKGFPAGTVQPKEAMLAGIAANLLSHPKVIAEVGRGMTLTITPTALETAASAELRVDLESGEDAPPTAVSGPADKKPEIDRVTKSTVSDTVRVESLKLFEISTFGMNVEFRKDFIFPIVGDVWQAVFGSVPILNGLFRWKGALLENRSHGSIAIVGAIVVPTATDLGYSIRFEGDRELVSEGAKRIPNAQRLFADAGTYHRQKMRCLRGSREIVCKDKYGNYDKGGTLEMSDVIGDENEIKSEVK